MFQVYDLIKSWADFCLLENHSYVKFIRDPDTGTGPPTSFYVIRVTSKVVMSNTNRGIVVE